MQKENTMTVGRWCGRWFIANRHKWDGNTEGGYRNLIYSHILPSIGSTVSEAVSAPHTKASLITYENNKLRTRYAEYLKARELPPSGSDISITDTIAEITTDDERIVLYYILHENVRKVSKSTISSWLNKCEIRGVNVDNAFDLLSSFDNGAVNNDTLEFGIDTFRKYSANAAQILPPLKKCVDQHIELAVNIFKKSGQMTRLILIYGCLLLISWKRECASLVTVGWQKEKSKI